MEVTAHNPNVDGTYCKNHGIISLTGYSPEKATNNEILSVFCSSGGFSGVNINDMEVISFQEFSSLSDELQKNAVVSSEYVISPPTSWVNNSKSLLQAFIWGKEGAIKNFKSISEFEWEIPEYHSIVDEAKINGFDTQNSLSLDNVKTSSVKPGQIYLSDGSIVTYTIPEFGPKENSTEFRIDKIGTEITDTKNIKIIQAKNLYGLSNTVINQLEKRENVWIQTEENSSDFPIRRFYYNVIRPKSTTSKLIARKCWIDYYYDMKYCQISSNEKVINLKRISIQLKNFLHSYVFDKCIRMSYKYNL